MRSFRTTACHRKWRPWHELDKVTEPSVFYIGFNMDDPGGRAAGARGRKLRQAMSLVIDSEQYLELFDNGRGVPAQSPLPPGLFGS